VDFTEGFMKKLRLLEGLLCVNLFSVCCFEKKI